MLARYPQQTLGVRMMGSSQNHLSIDASPLLTVISGIIWIAVAGLSWYAWHRTGYDRATGALELLRLLIATLAIITLFQPEWHQTVEPPEQPVLAILKDASASMQTVDVVDDSQPNNKPISRAEAMRSGLQSLPWQQLEGKVRIVEQKFGASRDGVVRSSATDIHAALADARRQWNDLRAVILLSDGDWNQGDSPVHAATQYRVHQIPIYSVGLGSRDPLPDVELAALEPPAFSVVGKSLQVPFVLRSTLATDVETDVALKVDGQVQQEKRIALPAMGDVHDMFYWTPKNVGNVTIELVVSQHASEVLPGNNQAAVDMTIKDESLNVLIVESVPRWEYRYLRNALQRDPGVDVDCLLFHPSIDQRQTGPAYLPRFPATDQRLSGYDVIFLGDVGLGDGQLSAEDCRRIKALVASQASGLVLIPGIRGHQQTLFESPLDDLYPVVFDPESPKGFGSRHASRLLLTAEGEASLLTKLADTTRENSRVWRNLPGVQWRSPAFRARAGTNVLAIHEQSRAPILVTKTYGTGKILFMGTDGAWRWRAGVEDQYHYRFWGQVARWMAYQRQMAEGELLRVFYTPDRPTTGNTVTINTTVLDPSGAPLRDATVVADIKGPEGAARQLRFLPVTDGWGLYSARFTPEQEGRHELLVRCDETSAELATEIQAQGMQRERLGKPARHDVLQEIADISGGQLVASREIDRLGDLVLRLPSPEPTAGRSQIWASPIWAGVLLFAMVTFWIGRKLVGAV